VRRFFLKHVRPVARRFGVDIISYPPRDFDDLHRRIWATVQPYTMTSPERVVAAIEATRYVVRNQIPGAIVECGVWRGGSSMAVAMTLLEMGAADRDLYLYDTFAGMSAPTAEDLSYDGTPAKTMFDRGIVNDTTNKMCRSPMNTVAENLDRTGYPRDRIKLVRGKVEDTIPATMPGGIALLRLDTDWYESTRHELVHLYPQLRVGGVLIIDDYGDWQGARKAVDEYFAAHDTSPLLNRIDTTGRVTIRVS
jgi:hypothetical protein